MYKKYLSVSIMMLAPMCANAGGDYTVAIQQLDAEIARLQAQNQAGLEELQECEKKVKGFKISGITTLSLTGVGIGVNIGEAVKLNKLEQQSSALDTEISEKQAELQRQKEAAGESSGNSEGIQEELEPQTQTVKEFLSSKVNVGGTGFEYWNFGGYKSYTTQYVKKKGDWATIYDYGVITGVAKCSTTSGEYNKPGNPQDDTGQHCWCKMTQLKKTEETNFLPAVSRWVFAYAYGSAAACASNCARNCAGYVCHNAGFRAAVLGGVN